MDSKIFKINSLKNVWSNPRKKKSHVSEGISGKIFDDNSEGFPELIAYEIFRFEYL